MHGPVESKPELLHSLPVCRRRAALTPASLCARLQLLPTLTRHGPTSCMANGGPRRHGSWTGWAAPSARPWGAGKVSEAVGQACRAVVKGRGSVLHSRHGLVCTQAGVLPLWASLPQPSLVVKQAAS